MQTNSMKNVYSIIDHENRKYIKIYEKIGVTDKNVKNNFNPPVVPDKEKNNKMNIILDR